MTESISDDQPKVSKCLTLLISAGSDDSDRTIEEFYEAANAALVEIASAKRVVLSNQYYIIDGVVCLPGDYDPATKDRKPGTFPPPWAGGPIPAHTPRTPIEVGTRPSSKSDKKKATAVSVDAGLDKVEEALAAAQAANNEGTPA